MLSNIAFPAQPLLPSTCLPLTLISLESWTLIKIHGVDTIKYLQGQLTCNVESLRHSDFSFAAHCDARGKMISNLCIFYYDKGMGYIERYSVCNSQLSALKKYSILSKITIETDNESVLLGVAGFQAKEALSKLFNSVEYTLGPVIQHEKTTLIHFNLPTSRFLIITTLEVYHFLQKNLMSEIQLNNSQQWLALDIEAGYPLIDNVNSAKFIPQATNIQALGGIDFKKGCYVGQETVARAKYRGANKHSLYWLSGTGQHIPIAGDYLEINMGENHWRSIGTVLAACQLKDKTISIQAVMNNNLSESHLFRIRNDSTSVLNIHPLPYIIKN